MGDGMLQEGERERSLLFPADPISGEQGTFQGEGWAKGVTFRVYLSLRFIDFPPRLPTLLCPGRSPSRALL